MDLKRSFLSVAAALGLMAATGGLTGCAVAPKEEAKKESLHAEGRAALARMEAEDSGLHPFVANAYGYAIFPNVSKAGFILGVSYGQGEVYQQKDFIGYADITKLEVGAVGGGQSMDELIVFESPRALDDFKYGKLKLTADASVVALKAGAASSANYRNGVVVFVRPVGGLMVEAAVGGQEFGFHPESRDVTPPHSEVKPPATQPSGT